MHRTRRKTWRLAAGAGLMLLAAATQASAACAVRTLAQLRVDQSTGLPLIAGSINGRTVQMVASSSGRTALYRSALPSLDLHEYVRRDSEIYGVGGVQTIGYTLVDSLRLADMPQQDLDHYMVDNNFRILVMGEKTPTPQPYAGALGAGFWSLADDDFDVGGGAVRLLQPKDCKGDEIVDWPGTHSSAPLLIPPTRQIEYLVTVTINGVPLRALLDSGAGASVITANGARKLGLADPLSGGQAGRGLSTTGKATVPSRLYSFKTFAIGGETIRNPKILYADIYDAHGFAPDGQAWRGQRKQVYDEHTPDILLGTDFFRSHRVLISNSQRKVYFAYNGAPAFE